MSTGGEMDEITLDILKPELFVGFYNQYQGRGLAETDPPLKNKIKLVK